MTYLLARLSYHDCSGWRAKNVMVLNTQIVDSEIEIELPSSWDDFPVKKVVFTAGDLRVSVDMTGEIIKVPCILFERPYCYLHVGVAASDIEYDEEEAERAKDIKKQMDEKLDQVSHLSSQEDGFWDLMEEYNKLKEDLSNVNLPKRREGTTMYNLGLIRDFGKPVV